MVKIADSEDPTLNNSKPKKNKKKDGAVKKKIKSTAKKYFLIHLPIILLIIFIIGLAAFVITMPGLVIGHIDEWCRNILGNIQKRIFGDDSIKITDQEIIDLAQHLENMGYDIQGYGLGNPIYEKDQNGDPVDSVNSRNGRSKKIVGIGESVDGKNYLRMYLADNMHTYSLADFSLKGAFDSAFSWFDSTFNGGQLKTPDDSSTGMIKIVGANADTVKKHISVDVETKKMTVYNTAVDLNDFGILGTIPGMVKDAVTGSSVIQSGTSYSYDLDNWTSRYGRPTELFLALHLSTLMPDLTYRLATDEEFNTKVDLAMMPLNVTYEVEATKGDETINKDKIEELYNSFSSSNQQHEDADIIPNTNWTYGEITELAELAKSNLGSYDVAGGSIIPGNNEALKEAPVDFNSVSEDNGHFTKYNLTPEQCRDIAKVCCREQGNTNMSAIAAEVSLMANIFESKRNGNTYIKNGTYHRAGSIYDFVRNDEWFGYGSKSANTMDSPNGESVNPVTDEAVQMVTDVLVKGKRTLPIYVLEHDCWELDIEENVLTNGKLVSKWEQSNYIKDNTIIYQDKNRFDHPVEWTFFCFPSGDMNSDPFGYYQKTDEGFYYILPDNYVSTGSGSTSSLGSFDMLWPFIAGVENHWFYKDIDFTKNVYRFAKNATKQINYKPEKDDSLLNKNKVDVKLNANLTSNMGVIYQVADPEAYGPNEHILEVFGDKYYKYDGSIDRAKKIANAKAGEPDVNKSYYSFNGEDRIPYNKAEAEKIEKEEVSFVNNKEDSFTAFGMLENMHTEASDHIYRNLKELMLYCDYFSEEELSDDAKEIMLWPIKTDNADTTWRTEIDTDEFGMTIYCNENETTVLAPFDAKVKQIDGNSITLKFRTLNEEAARFLIDLYKIKEPYKNINRDMFTGMTLTIENIKLDPSIKKDDTIKRGANLGEAIEDNNRKYSIKINMYNLDDSRVEDLSTYLKQEENSKYEEIWRNKQKAVKQLGEKPGLDISAWLNMNSSESGSVALVTETTLSKEEFIQKAKAYSSNEFSKYAGIAYDVCKKNHINPVICAVQAWIEQTWGYPATSPDPFNYWGLGVYNGKQHSIYSFDTMEQAVQKYCDNLNSRVKAEQNGDKVGNMADSAIYMKYDNKYTGGVNTIYDVFSNYACVDDADNHPKEQAQYAIEYCELLIDTGKEIFGDNCFASYTNGMGNVSTSVKQFLEKALSVQGAGYSISGYYWSGDVSTSYFTCSGLVDYALGLPPRSNSPETYYDKVKQKGNLVHDTGKLKNGDLVFYEYAGRYPGHIGIYLGNGKILDSANEGVRIRDVNWMTFIGGGSFVD